MNFKEIIKEEWEKEFPEAAELCTYENSLVIIYEQMIEKICVKVWNQAIETCVEQVETKDIHGSGSYFSHMVVDEQSLLKLKINEQGTDTPEV